MDKASKDILQQIKILGLSNSDTIETVFSDILNETKTLIEQKKGMIERMLGEITQLKATETLLTRSLSRLVQKELQDIADEKRTAELMELRKRQAEDRLKEALESEGVPPVRSIVNAPTVVADEPATGKTSVLTQLPKENQVQPEKSPSKKLIKKRR